MTPKLAKRGRLVLASALTFILVGAVHTAPALVALGGMVLSALLSAYLWFFPTAVLLRRKKIELSWWVPPGDQPGGALAVERPFDMHVAFRNHGGRRLRILEVGILGTRSLELPDDLEAVVPPGRQVEVIGQVRSHSAGYQVIHGAALTFGDVLGLFSVRAYFPNPLSIKVFPRQAHVRSQALRPQVGAVHEHVGQHHIRRRGLAGELREIRDHAPGDSFKLIAWKSTARHRKLMVRDLETEIVLTNQILVDIAGSMRGGSPGHTKLDYAIDTAAAIARTAIEAGDRVGLMTFDSRVYSELKPDAGHHHYLMMIDRLLETHNVVDEDLTDLTPGELIAAVAEYLAHQEAVDVRLRYAPPLDDPRWQHIQAGPAGELYDTAALGRVVRMLLNAMGKTETHKVSAPAWWWSRVHVAEDADPQMADIRLFCRLRGIDLPYRTLVDPGMRNQGLADAARRVATQGRSDVIVLISDLRGLGERPDLTMKAIARMRRRGQRMYAIAPFGPSFARQADTTAGKAVADSLRRDEREIFDRSRRLLMSHSIPVVETGPDDNPIVLMRRIARARSSMRRVA